ncbi:MAG: hypothetical protein HZB50_11975 [Chloroflexi bacterium]|nr:hypothetical protein [Chloroflexota bacterium]
MKKLITSTFLVLALLVMTVGAAFAQESTTITGTVQAVVLETDATTGVTTVVVTLLNDAGTTQTVRISVQTAESFGLVVTDPTTGLVTVAVDAIGKVVQLDPSLIIDDEQETQEPKVHPVGSALSNFFSGLLGVNYETIMAYHDQGVGFGVITQALWLTSNVGGDTTTFEALIVAKQSNDYSTITLADGSTPRNWGDVVRSLKKGNNLGHVMSGRGVLATPTGTPPPPTATPAPGINTGMNGNNGNGNGGNNGHGNGNNGNNGNGHGNGNGGGQHP